MAAGMKLESGEKLQQEQDGHKEGNGSGVKKQDQWWYKVEGMFPFFIPLILQTASLSFTFQLFSATMDFNCIVQNQDSLWETCHIMTCSAFLWHRFLWKKENTFLEIRNLTPQTCRHFGQYFYNTKHFNQHFSLSIYFLLYLVFLSWGFQDEVGNQTSSEMPLKYRVNSRLLRELLLISRFANGHEKRRHLYIYTVYIIINKLNSFQLFHDLLLNW